MNTPPHGIYSHLYKYLTLIPYTDPRIETTTLVYQETCSINHYYSKASTLPGTVFGFYMILRKFWVIIFVAVFSQIP